MYFLYLYDNWYRFYAKNCCKDTFFFTYMQIFHQKDLSGRFQTRMQPLLQKVKTPEKQKIPSFRKGFFNVLMFYQNFVVTRYVVANQHNCVAA